MNVQSTGRAARELTSEEIALVAGGDRYLSYRDSDGAMITERWSNDMSTFYGLTADYSAQSYAFDFGSFFACLGASYGAAGGFCYGGGDLYAYVGLSAGADGVPVDVTVGTSSDVGAYLEGVSVAANGQPGLGVSFNPDGTIASTAWVTGTPGASVTYGVNISDAWSNALEEFARGMYEMMGSPYDPPGDPNGEELPTYIP